MKIKYYILLFILVIFSTTAQAQRFDNVISVTELTNLKSSLTDSGLYSIKYDSVNKGIIFNHSSAGLTKIRWNKGASKILNAVTVINKYVSSPLTKINNSYYTGRLLYENGEIQVFRLYISGIDIIFEFPRFSTVCLGCSVGSFQQSYLGLSNGSWINLSTPLNVSSGTATYTNILNQVDAYGGTKTINGSYTYYTFSQNGTFQLNNSISNIEVHLVGGGGGGGGYIAGGGGSGYIQTFNISYLPAGTYPVIVGTGGHQVPNTQQNGTNGNYSEFINSTYRVDGGEGGKYVTSYCCMNGSSGGGRKGDGSEFGGENGGNNGSSTVKGTGQNSSTHDFGDSSMTLRGGGGGGGADTGYGKGYGLGGDGGGGDGGYTTNPVAGTNGTGGGGGGAGWTDSTGYQIGARGGDGIVIIRFLTNQTLIPNFVVQPQNHPISENKTTNESTVLINLSINTSNQLQNIQIFKNTSGTFDIILNLTVLDDVTIVSESICSPLLYCQNISYTPLFNLTNITITGLISDSTFKNSATQGNITTTGTILNSSWSQWNVSINVSSVTAGVTYWYNSSIPFTEIIINSSIINNENDIFISKNNNIYRLNNNSIIYKIYLNNNITTKLYNDSSNIIYGSYNKLYVSDKRNGTILYKKFLVDNIKDIAIQENILVNTNKFLYVFDKTNYSLLYKHSINNINEVGYE